MNTSITRKCICGESLNDSQVACVNCLVDMDAIHNIMNNKRNTMKRYEQFNENDWLRRCQECGHVQVDTRPFHNTEPSKAWTFRKCKKCKSEALDYGCENYTNEDDE